MPHGLLMWGTDSRIAHYSILLLPITQCKQLGVGSVQVLKPFSLCLHLMQLKVNFKWSVIVATYMLVCAYSSSGFVIFLFFSGPFFRSVGRNGRSSSSLRQRKTTRCGGQGLQSHIFFDPFCTIHFTGGSYLCGINAIGYRCSQNAIWCIVFVCQVVLSACTIDIERNTDPDPVTKTSVVSLSSFKSLPPLLLLSHA